MTSQDHSKLARRLTRLMGSRPTGFHAVEGGYTKAYRSIVEFSDGRRAFVKMASDSPTAAWLRDESKIYLKVSGNFMPKMLAWEDDQDAPLLILEDLSSAHWPKVWTQPTIDAVLRTLKIVGDTLPPEGLASAEILRPQPGSWRAVQAEPEPFLSMNLCSINWLKRALPVLIASEEAAQLAGQRLLHLDVRSDNICFVGERVVLVDWNWACLGNPELEIAFWLPSVACEGGPLPHQLADVNPAVVAFVSGFWAWRAGMLPPHPGSTVRDLQRRQLQIALPWCVRLLDLPLLDGPSPQTIN